MKIFGTLEKTFGKIGLVIICLLITFTLFLLGSELISYSDTMLNLLAVVSYFLFAYMFLKTLLITFNLFINKNSQNEKNN